MKRIPIVPLIGLLLLVPAPVAAEGESPTYNVGDYWRYSFESPAITGTINTTITGTRQLAVGGSTYTVWAGDSTGSGTYDDGTYAGPVTMSGYTYLDAATLRTVKESLAFDAVIAPKAGGNNINLHINSTQTYDPPIELQHYPLAAGNSWSVLSSVREQTENTVDGNPVPGYPVDKTTTLSTTFSVPSRLNKTVTAGTFEVFVIKNATLEFWFSDVVGSTIMVIDTRAGDPTTFELISYRYQGPPEDPGTPNAPGGGFLPASGAVAALAATGLVAIGVRDRRRHDRG